MPPMPVRYATHVPDGDHLGSEPVSRIVTVPVAASIRRSTPRDTRAMCAFVKIKGSALAKNASVAGAGDGSGGEFPPRSTVLATRIATANAPAIATPIRRRLGLLVC